MTRKQFWILLGVLLAVDAITIPFVIMYATRQKAVEGEAGRSISAPNTLPSFYEVPDFTFTAQDNTPFGKAQLAGKIWVVDVFFTSCAGPCPVMSRAMSDLAKNYAPASGVHFVSMTVDPQYDTPEVLSAYAKKYEADLAEWTFLTGDSTKLQDFAKTGLKLGSVDSPLLHSEHFVLVDRKGNVRGYFIGTDPAEVAQLKSAIDTLLKEPAASN